MICLVSASLWTVMSSMSSRSMRLRSFDWVVEARHTRGRSWAKFMILALCSGVTIRALWFWNTAASALIVSRLTSALFHRCSRLEATNRLDGSTSS